MMQKPLAPEPLDSMLEGSPESRQAGVIKSMDRPGNATNYYDNGILLLICQYLYSAHSKTEWFRNIVQLDRSEESDQRGKQY